MQQADSAHEQKEVTTEDSSLFIPNSCPSTPEYVPSSAPSVHASPIPRNGRAGTDGQAEASARGHKHGNAEHASDSVRPLLLNRDADLVKRKETKNSQTGLESQNSTRQKLEFIDLTDSPVQSAASKVITNEHTETKMAKGEQPHPEARLQGQITKSPSIVHPPKPIRSPLPFSPKRNHLNLDRALKRHLDWTPVKDTVSAASPSKQSGSPAGRKFGVNLFARFKYDTDDTEARSNQATTSINRNRTELLPISERGAGRKAATTENKASSSSSSKRSKTAKKYSTITGRATSKYRAPAHSNATIREFFHSSQEDSENTAATLALSGKRKSRRKLAPTASSLVAPANAVESLNQQQWQFGTASQLSRDVDATSPDGRRLSVASDASDASSLVSSSATSSITRSKYAASRGLWSAGARDLQGKLQDANVNEVIALSDSEPHDQEEPIPKDVKDQRNIDEVSVVYESDIAVGSTHSDEEVATEKELSSTQTELMPDFDSYTASQIAELLAKYSLKPIKARKRAIEMLKDCWLSEHNGHAGSVMPSQATDAPLDNEDGRSRKSSMPPSQMDKPKASTQAKAEDEDPLTSDLAIQLFRAVQSQPRPTGFSRAGKLTWHEKILLYDPISVEELTLWLNTGGLNRVGEDREVSPLFVRSWCEHRGICCYMK